MAQDLELRIRISADGRAAIEGTQQVEQQIDRLGETAKKVGALIAGYLSFQFLSSAAQQLFEAGAALQAFQTRFNSLAGSERAAAAEMAYVQQAAQKLALDLNTARDSYAQLLAQQQAGVITQQQARDLLEGFGRAAQMTGAGAEQVKQAMAGLSQALSAGTVSTEDFRQAVDPLPGMMKNVADALGVSIGQLKENLAKGKVSSADFATAMIQGLQKAGQGAEDFSQSLGATWQRVQNNWTRLLEAFGAADFLSMLENSSFNEMAQSILTTLEQTLQDATALIQSGWLSDAFAAEIAYIQSFWADLGHTLADDQFFNEVRANWDSLWEGIADGAADLLGDVRTVFTDFPEIIAAFTVIAASQIDSFVSDAKAAWERIKAAFTFAWDAMKAWLASILAQMTAAVATASAKMVIAFTQQVSGMAQAVAAIPGVGDAMVGIVQSLGDLSHGATEWAATTQQSATQAKANLAGVKEAYDSTLKSIKETQNAEQQRYKEAAQQTVLELHGRTEARDAALEKAQADRVAAAATAANTPITQANSAAQAANAAETDKAAKAKKTAADKIAEQSQKLVQETAALEKLTAAYLTFNDATVAQVQIENELDQLDPALRVQGHAKALAELNNQTAKRLYDLDYEAQLTAQEALATLQGAAALADFNLKKELESVLRERNTGALDKETAQVVEQKIAAEQLAKAADAVMDAYEDSRTPLEKYTREMERIAELEATLKGTAGAWTESAARGIEALKNQAQEALNAADPLAQAFKSAAEGIYHAWSGMWESLFTKGIQGFGDVVEQIKTMFLKMLAQLAASALAKPILLPVIQSMGGLFGLDSAGIAPIVNNLFGAGTMSGVGGVASGLGNLFGGTGGGLGDLLGLGSLFGSSGGSLAGFLSMDGVTSFMGSELLGSLATGLAPVLSFLPVIGALGALAGLLGDFGPTPHPSSIATVGGFWSSENGPEYPGKGGGKTGASGLVYGYDYGHTDPAEAAKIRDAFMEIDQALVSLVPDVDLAGRKLGEFGQTAEGFIANGEYVASMDEVTAGFVQAWVGAAAETGAVSELVNQAFQSMTGTAEELLTAFSALQQMDAAGTLNQQMIDIALALQTGSDRLTDVLTALGMIQGYSDADPLKDFETLLNESLKTTFDRLGESAQGLADGLADVNWTDASSIQALAGQVQARYALELQLLQEIHGALDGLAANFGASIEEVQLSVMDRAQKYDYFAQQAAASFAALQTATDPAQIAQLAEDARQAAMSAYGLLDDAQKQQVSAEFIGFLEQTQGLAQEKLNAAQEQVLEQHRETAEVLAEALNHAGEAAADALEQAAHAVENAGNTAANAISGAAAAIRDALRSGEAVSAQRMASGGFVGGTWNGRAGPAGDTVATMLTPGEAVISRAQTQKHAGLLRAIMADEVRYAAAGVLPSYGGGAGGADGLAALNAEIEAAFAARRQADLEALRRTYGEKDDAFASPEAEEFILGLRHYNAEQEMLNRLSAAEQRRESAARTTENADELAQFMANIQEQLDTFRLTEFERALKRLQTTLADNLAKAQALGASEEQLAQIRELAGYQAQDLVQQQVDLFTQAAADVADRLADLTANLQQLGSAIQDNLLDLQRQQPGWNEVAYQSAQVNQLKAQLAGAQTAPVEERIALAEQLRAAIMARYQAEQDAQQALAQQQQQANQEQRAALEKLVQIARNLKNYLDSLRLSELSVLSPEQKLAEAQRQYQSTLTKARTGDPDAQGAVQGAAQAYLEEARAYYASSAPYADIFTQVTTTLESLATAWQAQSEGGLARLEQQTLTPYETQSLAQSAAATQELQALLPQLAEWQAEAQAAAAADTAQLEKTLIKNTTAITSAITTSGALLGVQLNTAISTMTGMVSNAIAQAAAATAAAQAAAAAAAAATGVVDNNGGAIPARAGGGYTLPGWTLVGEEGPELVNFTAPNRVYPAADTRVMLAENAGGDREAVVRELQALIRLQSAANQQLLQKLAAMESRLAGIESKARLEAAA